MQLSIESIFLFGCALFILYYIINGCGCTNVEGYQCGTCPISTARCPDRCQKIESNNEFFCKGHTEKCDDCGFEAGAEVCFDTGARNHLYIGNLNLKINIEANDFGIVYIYSTVTDKTGALNGKWYVYKSNKTTTSAFHCSRNHIKKLQTKIN